MWVVLVFGGALGAMMGMSTASWQAAVEPAQVVAGLVRYSPDNVIGLFHTRMWSVLHQLCALLLLCGVSESTLSIGLSGVLGVIIVQALALCVWALSRRLWVAIGTALLVWVSQAYNWGIVYPVMMAGELHTYGIIGIPLMLMIPSLFACGCYRTAAFLLGVVPAVHPSIGIWCGIVTAVTGLMLFRHYRDRLQSLAMAFAAGCGLTLVSLGAHYMFTTDASTFDPEMATKWVQMYVELWDEHRRRFSLLHVGFLIALSNAATALLWLRRRVQLPVDCRFLLLFLAVTFCMGTLGSLALWLPVQSLPRVLLVLMPPRILNLMIICHLAVIVGLACSERSSQVVQLMASVVILGLTVAVIVVRWVDVDELFIRGVTLWGMGALTLGLWLSPFITAKRLPNVGPLVRQLQLACCAVLVVLSLVPVVTFREAWRDAFVDRQTDPVWHRASTGEGVLLVATDMYFAQLRLRRPIVLDPCAIDALPYVPEAGPMATRVLRELYGHDLLRPRSGHSGHVVRRSTNRQTWEAFTLAQWQQLASDFGFTEVLTHHGWRLQLPVVTQDAVRTLYRIPGR